MTKVIFRLFLLVLFTAFAGKALAQNCKEVVGYYPNWQWYDRSQLVNPSTIDYSKYTIINYAFFRPELDGTISSTDSWADENLLNGQPDWQNGGYLPNTSIVDLAHNAGVEVLPSIGGWTLSDNFPSIAASSATRAAFADACVDLINEYNFDGIDLDWEYPNYAPHNGTPADIQNFTLLLQEIRTALDELTAATGQEYLLTAALGAAPSHIVNIEWENVTPLLDIINLMSYDFYGVWDGVNNHNSPLYAAAQGTTGYSLDEAFTTLTTQHGVPADKITLGVAFYGRSAISSTPQLFSPNSGSANSTLFWQDEGTPLYYNILPVLNQFTQHYDSQSQVPWLEGISNNTFLSYDDEQSVTAKAQYVVDNGARGVIIWEITGDYIQAADGSIAGTPLATALNNTFCGTSDPLPQPPTVSILTPSVNSEFATDEEINFSVNAADSDGSVTSVEFSVNGEVITHQSSGNNYTATWSTGVAGSYLFSVIVTDDEGLTASANRQFTVETETGDENEAPVLSVLSPADNAVFTVGDNLDLSAAATDADGDVVSVNFNLNGQNITGVQEGNNWSAAYTTSAAGTYTLMTVATDNDGLTASDVRTFTVHEADDDDNDDNTGGGTGISGTFTVTSDWGTGYCADVTLTNNTGSAINGWELIFSLNADITSLWNAEYTVNGNVYNATAEGWNADIPAGGTAELGFCAQYSGALTPPFDATLNGIPVDFGGEEEDEPDPIAPTVSITSPQSDAVYEIGNNVTLTAQAADTDGSVVSVIFQTAGQTIAAAQSGNIWTAEYAATSAGAFTALVTATDDDGLTTTDAVQFSVESEPESQAPTVSITSPQSDAVYEIGNNVTLTVQAADTDGSVVSVIFQTAGQTIAAAQSGDTWTAEYAATSAGAFTVLVTATDDEGLTATDAVQFSVESEPEPQAPTVSITSPQSDAVYEIGNTVTLTAQAADTDGSVVSVIFQTAGQTIAAAQSGDTWTAEYAATSAGTYTAMVTATDDEGLTATDAVQFSVEADEEEEPNGEVTGTFTVNSDWGTGYCAEIVLTNNGTTAVNGWTLTFTTADNITSLWNGDYTADGNEITVTDGGWNGTIPPGGTATFGYCADYAGSITVPADATFNGQPIDFGANNDDDDNTDDDDDDEETDPVPPVVSFLTPDDNAEFLSGTEVTLSAVATDADGTITDVQFIVNGQSLSGQASGSAYSVIWTAGVVGNYLITVTATDDTGLTSSDNVSIVIVNEDDSDGDDDDDDTPTPQPPTVVFSSPTNGATLAAGVISLQAAASDSDGTIASVFFSINGQIINATDDGGGNYSANWDASDLNGYFQINVSAADDEGLPAESSIYVTVQNPDAANDLTLSNLPLQINVNAGASITYTFDAVINDILFRNLNVADMEIDGNEVTFFGVNPGRTGLRIQTAQGDYFIGLRVNHTDGTMPGMPDYLSVGSVSEDIQGDLDFWKDVNEGQMNKSMDIRYIYINGGPFTGWSSWGPDRPEKFARESMRFGLIPFFVYYQIPDGGESYFTDLQHIQDPEYMTAYFEDMDNFMGQVQNILQGELYGIILEPDFLGYMQQNADPNDPLLIPTAVNADEIGENVGNIRTLVERINSEIDGRRALGHNLLYGWQLNLWAYPVAGAGQGVLRLTDDLGFTAGRNKIREASEQTTLYAMQAGVLSHHADFLSIDKYGLDAIGHINSPNPANSTWFFNNDHWHNYLYFAKNIHLTSGYPVILWQLPVGHINESQYVSAYTGNQFAPLPNTHTKYEDSTTDFFLGDTFTAENDVRLDYFSENLYADDKLEVSGNAITYGSHMEEVKDAGIVSVLFGAGVGASTDGIGAPPTDDYFWIQKVQDYYLDGPIPLDSSIWVKCTESCPPVVNITLPAAEETIVQTYLSPIDFSVNAWDPDGNLFALTASFNGQSFGIGTNGLIHTFEWTPPAFGDYTLIVTGMDNDFHIAADTLYFSVIEFDPSTCDAPLWDAATVYNVPGTQVAWDAYIYENMWWTQGDTPGAEGTSPWVLTEPCMTFAEDEEEAQTQDNQGTTPPPSAGENTLQNPEIAVAVQPNPSSGAVNIIVDLPTRGMTEVSVFDAAGQPVKVLANDVMNAGRYLMRFNGDGSLHGVFTVRIATAAATVTRRVVVLE